MIRKMSHDMVIFIIYIKGEIINSADDIDEIDEEDEISDDSMHVDSGSEDESVNKDT